jgi:FkbM family methyltransferase
LDQLAAEYGLHDHIRLRPGDVVIDVGANIGEFALLCSDAGATVYALEPDVNAFLCLVRNVEGQTVVPLNLAAWKDDSIERLNMATASADSSFINETAESREVLVLRLDTLARLRRLERVRLLKCDAEGAEPEVLAGASELLRITDYVSFDCGLERAGSSTVRECTEILTRSGFEVVRRERGGRHNVIARNSLAPVPV